MTNTWVNFLALAAYGAAALLIGRSLVRAAPAGGATRGVILALAAAGLALHVSSLYMNLWLGSGLNLALTSAFSLISAVVTALYLLGTLARPIDNIGILILPFAALTVLVEWLWPGQTLVRETTGAAAVHIAVSVVAYGLLALAATQALLLLVQERRLHGGQPGGFLRALPPLQTMETLMFQMVVLGFVLLTATVISGTIFSEQVFGRPVRLSHHVLLSVLAWLVYGVLLFGRWRLGWRGRTAAHWTLVGFALLVLGYFGSKFVLEVLLHRG